MTDLPEDDVGDPDVQCGPPTSEASTSSKEGAADNGTRSGAPPQEDAGVDAIDRLVALQMRPPPLVAPPHDGDDLGLGFEPRTDHGNARRFVARYRHYVRHVPAWRTWLVWDGQRWERDNRNLAQNLARKTAILIWDEAEALRIQGGVDNEDVQKHVRWWNQSQSASRIEAMLRLAATDQNVIVTPDQLDDAAGLLNLENGTLNLDTGHVHPHHQRNLLTALAPSEWDGDEPCGPDCEWEGFLRLVVPDDEVRSFLQRYSAYAVSGRSDLKVAVFLHGNTDTGKTTFVETLRGVLGPDYTVEVADTLLVASRGDHHPTEVVDLHGKRLATVSELESGKRFDVAKFKLYTGGDRMKGRRLYQDFFEWRPTHAFLLTGNRKPEVRGSDDAFWRRMRVVKFDVSIPRDRQRENFAELLAYDHGPCVLAWLVRGMRDVNALGLAEPTGVIVATDSYRRDEDHVAAFLEDMVAAAPGQHVRTTDLHSQYELWCMQNGVKPREAMSNRAFAQELEARGWERKRTRTPDGRRPWCWHDVTLTTRTGVGL